MHDHKITDKDFLYKRAGPWPQPSPQHPFGESNAVLHLPLKQKMDWWMWIGSRYLLTLPLSIPYFIKGLFKPGLKPVSDEKFNWYFNHTMTTKFLSNEFDDADLKIFKDKMVELSDYYIVDLDAVKVVKPFDGVYTSGSKTLLIRDKTSGEFKVTHIYIEKTNEIFDANDGDAWSLAKYFVLQGVALCSTLVAHPLLHFPMDSINAITTTSIPKNHILLRLFYPHLRFTLALENAVLHYKTSLLQAKWWMPYAPYPGGAQGLRDLLVEGFEGIKGNLQYQAFKYPLRPPPNPTNYGVFLQKYFDVIRVFITKILRDVPQNDFWIVKWGDYVSHHVPGFPKGEELFSENKLIDAVSMYFWDITVGHNLDHTSFGETDKREIPLRIRQEAPKKGVKMLPRRALCNAFDLMKYFMADTLFFSPTTVTKLIKCEYDFDEEFQKEAVKEFHSSLRTLDKELDAKGMRYLKLHKIAASIQF